MAKRKKVKIEIELTELEALCWLEGHAMYARTRQDAKMSRCLQYHSCVADSVRRGRERVRRKIERAIRVGVDI